MTDEPRRPGAAERLAFARFVGAYAASAAGDALVAVALSKTLFFNVSSSQARSKIGLYLLLTMAPYSLLAPLVGPFLDRRRGYRRLAVVLAAGGRLIACVVMASCFDSLLLYPLAFVVLVLSRAATVTRAALVPSLVSDSRRFVSANARVARAMIVSGLVAGSAGILILKIAGESALLHVAGLVYLSGVVAGILLPKPGSAPPAGADEMGFTSHSIREAAVAQATVRALSGYVLFLLAFALKRQGTSSLGFGFVLGCSAAGGFAGALTVPRLRRAGHEEWIMVAALFLGASVSLIAGSSFGVDLAAILGAAVGLVGSASRLAFDSIVQREAPEAARGRAFARFETLFQLAWVIGAGVPVAFRLGTRGALTAATAIYGLATIRYLAGLGREGRARLVGGGPGDS